MGYFPFYINIENKRCLVVGGGVVALRKIEKLLAFNPKIKVVADEICDEIKTIDNIVTECRRFEDSDIDGMFFVISATDNAELNSHIFTLCGERNILVNTVDDKEKCSFIFPSLVKRENITVGVSTEGRSPVYARYMREKIESELDDNCDCVIAFLSSVRSRIKREIHSEEKRKRAFETLLELCITEKNGISDEKVNEIIEGLK